MVAADASFLHPCAGERSGGLSAAVRAAPSACERTAELGDTGLCLSLRPRPFDQLAGRERGEARDPEVNADSDTGL